MSSLDPKNLPPLLKPAEAARLLNVKVGTLATWRSRDEERVPFVRVGPRAVRYQLDVIIAMMGGQIS